MKTKLFFAAAWLLLSVGAMAQTSDFETLLKKARAGYVEAQMQTAVNYICGDGVEQDEAKGYYWFSQAAALNDPEGIYQTGQCHLLGRGTPKDLERGMDLIEQAAKAGYVPAQTCLGHIYEEGKITEYISVLMKYPYYISTLEGLFHTNCGISIEMDSDPHPVQDDQKAVYWMTEASNGGDAYASWALGVMYQNGACGLDPDAAKALQFVLRSAEQGCATAQIYIARRYHDSADGLLEPDVSKTFEWTQRAAENGSVEGMYFLGFEYWNGLAVEPDREKAVEWWLQAAESPWAGEEEYVAFAQRKIFELLRDGECPQKHEARALEMLRDGAGAGNGAIQFLLGSLYEGERYNDPAKAVYWLKQAADSGDPNGMVTVARLYHEGKGVAADNALAFEYLSRAADAGNVTAQENLSVFYWNGWGVARNPNKALELAVKLGDAGVLSGYTWASFFYSSLAARESNRKAVRELEQYAAFYARLAAERGDAEGQYILCLHYATGKGVKRDREMEMYWMKKAMEQGHQKAIELYNKLRDNARQYNQPWHY